MRIYQKQILVALLVASTFVVTAQKPPVYNAGNELFGSAMNLYSNEKYAAALELFDKVVDESVNRAGYEATEAEYMAGMCAIKLFNSDAEYRLTRFVGGHPESPLGNRAWLELADHFYQSKNYRKAIRYYDKVDRLELDEELLPSYYFKAGYSQFMRGDKKKAMLFFSDIMDIDTEYTPPAIYYFSHIAYENQMYRTALDGFMRLKSDKTFGGVVSFYIVQIMYILKDYDGIIANGPELLDVASEDRASELYRIIGDAYFQKEQYDKAVVYLEKHIELAKRTGREGTYQLAFCYYQSGETEKAIDLFKKVVTKRDELCQNAYYLLGDCYLKTGDKKLAQSTFSAASKLDFDKTIKEESLLNFAKLTYETTYSPFGEVIRAFQEYIEQYPGSDHLQEAYDYLVSAYMKVKNYKAAIESLDHIGVIDERLERAYQRVAFYRGLELFRNMRLDDALVMFDKSLKYARYDRVIRARTIYWKGETWYRLNQPDKALEAYEEFMGIPGASAIDEYSMVRYNLGYINYNNSDYPEALTWFKSYESSEGVRNTAIITDVFNRIADCYYISTDYDNAISYYDKVIATGGRGADYATFRKGFSLGLKHDQQGKVDVMTKLIDKWPSSSYVPNALFERGRAFVNLNRTGEGENDFLTIINDHSNSVFVPRAMVQLGLLYYNSGENNKALGQYKDVIEKYPATPESRNALTGLKNVYVDMNDVESYFAYVRSLDGFGNINDAERDSLLYQSGENLYISGDCERASVVFRNYLDEFDRGSFRLNASYYLAECLRVSGDIDGALAGYREVVSVPNNPFLEQTYLSLSEIYYNREIYDSAWYYYMSLDKVAELPENRMTAAVGLMRSAYYMGDPERTLDASVRVIGSQGISPELAREANFMAAKSNQVLDNTEEALDEYRKCSMEITTELGAESKYRVAEILFKSGKTEEAEQIINEFIEQSTPHQYWMARVFILLSDINLAKGDEFGARATLQSLVDYYQVDDDGILDEVRAKLDNLNAAELPENDTIHLSVDKKGK